MTSPPDLLRPFNLLDCFSFTQIVYITFTPVALFLAAYLSRTRLLLVSKVPHDPRTERRRRGRAWRAARIINESVEEELESNNAAREAQALLPAAEQIKKTSTDQLAVTPPPSRLYLVGAAGLCVALAAVDTLLVQAATSDSKDWTGVFFSFVFGITPTALIGHGIFWRLVGLDSETWSRQTSGAIVSTWNANTTPFALLLRLACYLAGFGVFPSLCLSPPLGIPLVPFVLIALAQEEKIGERRRLRTTMIAFAIIHLGGFLFIFYKLLTGSPADWDAQDGTPVLAVFDRGFAALMPFAFGGLSISPICGLYRLDHPFTQEEIDSLEPARAPTVTYDLEPKVGDDIVMTPLRITLSAWVNSLTRSRPTLSYSTAAILWTWILLAGLPVLFNYIFPSFPLYAVFLLPRYLAFNLSCCTLPLLVFGLAKCRGEVDKVWTYEEDWGDKYSTDVENL